MSQPKEKDFYHVSLKLILKNDQDQVLILNADPKGSLAGFYDLPGGRIDKDEFTVPFTEIIKREAAEEIGDVNFEINKVPVAIGRHKLAKKPPKRMKEIHVLYIFFEGKFKGGAVKISPEHAGFKWVDLKEHNLSDLFTSGWLEGLQMYLSR